MKPSSKTAWNPERLDVRAFARSAGRLQGVDALDCFDRLRSEAMSQGVVESSVEWQCSGEIRVDGAGKEVPWLRLEAKVSLPLQCQRCLGPVSISPVVDRWFRFVADEATAALEDEDSDVDVLALEPRPDMLQILEDELLMELPLVPMHDVCPVPVSLRAGDIDLPEAETAERSNPFAQLAKLKK